MKREIKQYDFVKLRKSARKAFYNRPERIEDFAVGGNLDSLTSEQVINFMDIYRGFENGKGVGVIEKIIDDTTKVTYYCPISVKFDYAFYLLEDLVKVWLILF